MRRIIRLENTSSTQDEAFSQADNGAADGTLIVAAEQTAGRGRLQREWVSPKDAGVYFSVVCRLGDASALPGLSFAAGIAVAAAIARLTSLDPRLKWPNDVLLDRKKVAGILVESRTLGEETIAAVGVGVNLRAEGNPFVQRKPERATAIDVHCDRIPEPESLAEVFADEFDDLRLQPLDRILKEWQKLDDTIGSQIELRLGEQTITGTAKGLDEHGALLVETPDGRIESFVAGDVTITRWQPRR
jgi:BirA family biotin operon repressor/biotin-[acetyl-CoA-carboxylase] ligase